MKQQPTKPAVVNWIINDRTVHALTIFKVIIVLRISKLCSNSENSDIENMTIPGIAVILKDL